MRLILIAVVATLAGFLGWVDGKTGVAEPAAAVKPASGERRAGEFPNLTVRVGNETRVYRLYVPRGVNLDRPVPLVVAFHGMGIDSKDTMPRYTKLNETAERHGFLIAYPQAVGGSWGLRPVKVSADTAFFDALIREIEGKYVVDANRVYVVGMSNGGYFAHLIAQARSDVVAAAAAHSGVKDRLFQVSMARENAEKYRREGHEVKYVELPNVGHMWGTDDGVNETIWAFFAAHPLRKG
jgi:polyhydroxybutyrate depolymerase